MTDASHVPYRTVPGGHHICFIDDIYLGEMRLRTHLGRFAYQAGEGGVRLTFVTHPPPRIDPPYADANGQGAGVLQSSAYGHQCVSRRFSDRALRTDPRREPLTLLAVPPTLKRVTVHFRREGQHSIYELRAAVG